MTFAAADIERIDWSKGDGLVPAIVQHASSGSVLMLGYMDRAALSATLAVAADPAATSEQVV